MSSKLSVGLMISGVVALFGLAGVQHLQLRTLEARLAVLESTGEVAPGLMSARGGGQPQGRAVLSGRGVNGAGSAATRPGLDKMAPAVGEHGSPSLSVGTTEDEIAKIFEVQAAKMREERHARWKEIGEQHMAESMKEFGADEGLDEAQLATLTDLMQGWHDDRRYLHEGVMDGSLTVAEMREEIRVSREELEQEIEQLIGRDASAALWERMPTRRGPF